jgi:hypothetical protein
MNEYGLAQMSLAIEIKRGRKDGSSQNAPSKVHRHIACLSERRYQRMSTQDSTGNERSENIDLDQRIEAPGRDEARCRVSEVVFTGLVTGPGHPPS